MYQKVRENWRMLTIFLLGCLLRFFYVINTSIFDRQYDIGSIDLSVDHTVSGGHLAYIQYLYQQGHLPDFDPTLVYQFNHPPMHHYLSAVVLQFFTPIIKDYNRLYETLQLIPFVSSILLLWSAYRIMRRLLVDERTLEFCMTILAFHPALILLSGSVNNDTLSLLFMVLCIDYTMEWCANHRLWTIIKAALAISLGMMTKQSVALMAFPMALVFIYEWVKERKKAKILRKTSIQYLIFLLVSMPIGLWFYIRNMVLYKMPLVWVYTLSEDTWQYTGNVPVINRFLWPDLKEFFGGLKQFQLGCGYNVWIQIMRTSVLGEWDMAGVGRGIKVLAMFLMLIAFALAMVVFSCDVIVGLRYKRYRVDARTMILLVSTYLVNFVAYLKFYYDYPQECSMSFRYIEIELFISVFLFAVFRTYCSKKWVNRLLTCLLTLFCLLSAGMIGVWGIGV